MSRNEPGKERVAQVTGRAGAKALKQQEQVSAAGTQEGEKVKRIFEKKARTRACRTFWVEGHIPRTVPVAIGGHGKQKKWLISALELSQFGC